LRAVYGFSWTECGVNTNLQLYITGKVRKIVRNGEGARALTRVSISWKRLKRRFYGAGHKLSYRLQT